MLINPMESLVFPGSNHGLNINNKIGRKPSFMKVINLYNHKYQRFDSADSMDQ